MYKQLAIEFDSYAVRKNVFLNSEVVKEIELQNEASSDVLKSHKASAIPTENLGRKQSPSRMELGGGVWFQSPCRRHWTV